MDRAEIGAQIDAEIVPVLLDHPPGRFRGLLEKGPEVEPLGRHLHRPGLDLREVRDVVHQLEEMTAGGPDLRQDRERSVGEKEDPDRRGDRPPEEAPRRADDRKDE